MSTTHLNNVAGLVNNPPDLIPVGQGYGRVRCAHGTKAVATTDAEAGDIIVCARVPSNCRPLSWLIWNDVLDSVADLTANGGAYYVGADGTTGTVIDVDFFASLITTLQAAAAKTELLLEATVGNHNKMGERLWEMLGLSTDPGGYIDIALTIGTVAATPVLGDLSSQFWFVVD